MKQKFAALCAVIAIGIASIVYALPHDNRGDVDKQVKIFFPYTAFYLSAAGAELRSFSSSDAVVTYISTNRIAALRMTNSNQDVPILISVPDNACLGDCPVQFSVVWSTNNTSTSNTATWRIQYSSISEGEVESDPSTDLSTTITSDAVDGDSFALQETPLGTLNADSITRNDSLQLRAELLSTSGTLDPANDTILFHGINFYYTRELL